MLYVDVSFIISASVSAQATKLSPGLKTSASQIQVGTVFLKVLLNQVPHLHADAAQDADFSENNCKTGLFAHTDGLGYTARHSYTTHKTAITLSNIWRLKWQENAHANLYGQGVNCMGH